MIGKSIDFYDKLEKEVSDFMRCYSIFSLFLMENILSQYPNAILNYYPKSALCIILNKDGQFPFLEKAHDWALPFIAKSVFVL